MTVLPFPEENDPVVAFARPEHGWIKILQQHVDEAWRPGEWCQSDWVFIGNPDNPRTRVFRCSMPGCLYLSQSPYGLPCKSCGELLKKVDGDLVEFQRLLATTRRSPRLEYGKVFERCRVERDGERCQRDITAQGVCEGHYRHWTSTYRRHGMSLDDTMAAGKLRPLTRLDVCRVRACPRDRTPGPLGLCLTHKEGYRFRRTRQERRGLSLTLDEYAATAGPVKIPGNFCLLGLEEGLRWEILYALQTDDKAGILLNPIVLNHASGRLEGETSMFAEGFLDRALDGIKKHAALPAWLRRAQMNLRLLHTSVSGEDCTAGDVWDSVLVGLETKPPNKDLASRFHQVRTTANRVPIDFRPIQQEWLRELVKQWARDTLPNTHTLLQSISTFALLSQVLSSRSGGDDPSTAGMADITRAVALLMRCVGVDGEPLSSVTKHTRLILLRRCLGYLRTAGFMADIPDSFTVTPEHKIKSNEAPEASGQALPNRAIAAIVANLDKTAPSRAQTGSMMSIETIAYMYRTAMQVLIDTGRRPNEVCSLRVGCVSGRDKDGNVEYTLTYDNSKAGRDGRRIPISAATARTILDWEQTRGLLGLPAAQEQWLFPTPAAGRSDALRHLSVQSLAKALGRLLAAIPPLKSDIPDRENNDYLPYSGDVVLYSFRHSYCQRHADAGVAVDTLRELMDHRSTNTTMGYYRVSAERKREAINAISGFTVNRHGESAPMSSATAYEVGTVAVPFGNCTEPTNVKAGGQHCPIRFRCAGCDMYRPDPSYLPALEQHLVDLRANLTIVELMGTAADWVTHEMKEEIQAYSHIVGSIRRRIGELDDEQRDALDEASVAMRRLRGHRPLLPIAEISSEGR